MHIFSADIEIKSFIVSVITKIHVELLKKVILSNKSKHVELVLTNKAIYVELVRILSSYAINGEV